jgi:hypothetical protein
MRVCETLHKCFECRQAILVGDTARYIYQQEIESCECDFCINQDDPDPEYDGPKECQEELGETFSCYVCSECSKILQAIKAVEIAEGCPSHAQQPMFGELSQVFHEHEQAGVYARKVAEMFPELKTHRFIADLISA